MVEVVDQSRPALQVIILGSGGGPLENNTTSLLVRSTASGWKRDSIVGVDAGVYLAAIVKILEGHASNYSPENEQRPVTLTDGPFAGLEIPHSSAKANAAYIAHDLINTHLITHPHLDHVSGFVVNTAGLPTSRNKKLAGLPSTIEALKTHIFNNVIWPNLSDENNGVGMVTYMRLVDGGSPVLGDGDGRGYVEVCQGLSVKAWGISHGHCIEKHSHRGSNAGPESPSIIREASPRGTPLKGLQVPRPAQSTSIASQGSGEASRTDPPDVCVYNSSAYFIRDQATGKEVLVFGDVEPDSLSLSPRNKDVWSEAAPMIVSGRLRGIFIECSFNDSHPTDRLFGHLSSKYLIEELKFLADEVIKHQELKNKENESKKRKRLSNGDYPGERSPRRSARGSASQASPIHPHAQHHSTLIDTRISQTDGNFSSLEPEGFSDSMAIRQKDEFPLKGFQVVIIHVKDKLVDGVDPGNVILQELEAYEETEQLGCQFIVSGPGQSLYL